MYGRGRGGWQLPRDIAAASAPFGPYASSSSSAPLRDSTNQTSNNMFNKSNPNNSNKLQNKVFINGPFAIALYKHLNPSTSLPAAVDP
jgi:hypothetical protein